ncbi:MAG TPA: HlyD family efflux transporter periplasmic adaptor subunit [Chitinophagaceae bacterium]|jgi:HlyD family secretion protein|nr:HlyD family efflux transporter periplasmic adaptor subunit [Chitinophagaceae bacterium]HMU57363.1 HlyD family efflux transporter periplasmic adaptor subunit [Chitinophagaceae bacterium]
MKRLFQLLILGSITVLASCKSGNGKYDATGTFEANEVIVSSELSGKILSFSVEEGMMLAKDTVVGTVDAANITLQKEQVEASVAALSEKTADVSPAVRLLENQLAVQQSQLNNLLHEQARVQNLLKQDAATGKQLDDITAQVDVARKNLTVTQQQINVQKNNVATQNRSILSEGKPLQKRVAQLDEQLKKANIINPVGGTVITKYAEPGEITATGKALYKIADLSTMMLRAYITGSQLSQIKLGQAVKVLVDDGADKYREIPGTISWISDKAEFTPKTIQTKDERANLVYATKIKVKNDGYLKIGMYGEVKF